jgi:hypothetical protein
MHVRDCVTIRGDLATFRPVGEFSTIGPAVDLVAAGIAYAAGQPGVRRMLVDLRELVGFRPPSIVERYDMMIAWTRAEAGRGIKLAMIARPEMLDPHKFDVLVAANRGLIGDAFTDEESALAWLERWRVATS